MKSDARIDRIFIGLWPPFNREPRLRIPASFFRQCSDGIFRVPQLGYTDGVLQLPFDTPSCRQIKMAPYVEYDIDLQSVDSLVEVRTLPTLHVYDGREARFAIQIGEGEPRVFDIHADDFTAEWRLNVLRGYASRSVPVSTTGHQRLRIYLLDPGIVLQEILVHPKHG